MEEPDVPSHPLDDIHHVALDSPTEPSARDQRLMTELSSHQLTQAEVCAVLNISRAVYTNSLTLQQAYQRGQEMGKASLRRMQWKMAPKSAVMQIWLGKQHLEQSDKLETKKDDGSQDEARQRFEDKLKSIIDVTPTEQVDEPLDPRGAGDRELLLAPVGEGEPDCSNERTVVEAREYPAIS